MGNLRVETTPNREREIERKTLGKKKAAPTDASIDSVITIINMRERESRNSEKREKGDLMLHDLTVNAFDFVRCVSSGVLLLPAAVAVAWGRKSKSFCCAFYSYRRDALPLIAPRRNVGAFARTQDTNGS